MRVPYKSMTKCILMSGHGEPDAVLDISPTMINLTHNGKSYFRMTTGSYKTFPDGSMGALYLWDGWGEQRLEEMEARNYEREPQQQEPTQ